MGVQAFLHRHYSPLIGESPIGHVVALLVGTVLMATGAVLAFSLVLLPLGSVVGIVGLLLAGGGLFAHIQRPVKLPDVLNAIVALTGAAIAGTFALGVLAIAAGLVGTAVFEVIQWLFR